MKMIVRHTRVELHDYHLGDLPKLEDNFLVWSDMDHCAYPKGMKYDNDNHILYLPRGFDVDLIRRFTDCPIELDQDCDPFDIVPGCGFKYTPRDETQLQAIQFMVGTGKYEVNKKKSQLFLNLPTGKGKTYCTIYATAYMKLRTLVIASNSDWLKQWKKFILEYTNLSDNNAYIITGETSINRLEKYGVSDVNYLLITHSTIRNYASKYGWDAVSELFKRWKIGIKVFDEAHLDFDNICNIDFATNTFKTIYITATNARSNKSQNVVYRKYFLTVPNINLFNKDTDPHTKYIAIKYDSQPTQREMMRVMSNPTYGFDRNNYANYVVNKPNYYRVLLALLKIGMKLDGKILIYIGTNEAIQKTHEWINRFIPALENQVGIYTSIIPDNEKPTMLEKKVILSTTKSCGAASDITDLKMTIVLAEPFKSEVLARQSLGRTRDPDTYYFECVDCGFVSPQRYYRAKKEVFSKYAISCTEIRLSEEDLYERVLDFSETFTLIQPDNMLINPIRIVEPVDPI